MRNQKGFTLIELLVVIAIIGILSSVVLASLNTARTKGKDAAAKSSMASIKAQAEIFADSSGNYPTDLCTADTKLKKLVDAVKAQVPTANTTTCTPGTAVGSPATAYSSYTVDTTLNDGTTFCVDSTGYSGVKGGSTEFSSGVKCK